MINNRQHTSEKNLGCKAFTIELNSVFKEELRGMVFLMFSKQGTHSNSEFLVQNSVNVQTRQELCSKRESQTNISDECSISHSFHFTDKISDKQKLEK